MGEGSWGEKVVRDSWGEQAVSPQHAIARARDIAEDLVEGEEVSLDVETGLDDDGEGDEAVEGEESGQALQIREAEAAGDDAADDGEELEDGVVDANVVLHLLGIDELKLLACGVRRLGGRRGGSVRRDPGGVGGSGGGKSGWARRASGRRGDARAPSADVDICG